MDRGVRTIGTPYQMYVYTGTVVRTFVRNHNVARLYSGRVDLLFLFSRFPPMQNRFGGYLVFQNSSFA